MRANLLYNYLVFALGHCCLQLLFRKISRAAGPAKKIKIKARKRRCPGIRWLSSDINTAGIRQTCWNAAELKVRVKIPWFSHSYTQNHKSANFPSSAWNLRALVAKNGTIDKQELQPRAAAERLARKEKAKHFQIEKCAKALLLKTRIIFAMLS